MVSSLFLLFLMILIINAHSTSYVGVLSLYHYIADFMEQQLCLLLFKIFACVCADPIPLGLRLHEVHLLRLGVLHDHGLLHILYCL